MYLTANIIYIFIDACSDQHDWFRKSENREPGFEDYYVWRNSSVPGQKVVPNNWVSVFSGPAWTWSEKRQQFYYHQFAYQQPDLNYHSESLRNEMQDILKFWIEKGVGGFRVDAINHLYEDPLFRNDTQIGPNPNNHDHFDHPFTKDMVGTSTTSLSFCYVDSYLNIFSNLVLSARIV